MTHGSNIYIDWSDLPTPLGFDFIMVDWCCTADNPGKYWAVHHWGNPDGYAGFQNVDGVHKVIFSLWNHNNYYPEIEYVSPFADVQDLVYNHEGSGKHILCNYNWTLNTWYTICVGTRTTVDRTEFAMWVSEQDTNKWILIGVISYPVSNLSLNKTSVFQEDFGHNNFIMKSRIKKPYVRSVSSGAWKNLKKAYITNRHYSDADHSTSNVTFDCSYEYNQPNDYVELESGGGTIPAPNNLSLSQNTFPHTIPLNNTTVTPSYFPTWSNLAPRSIKCKHNDASYYIAPGTGTTVVLSTTPYYWNFKDEGDGYFCILDSNNIRAITLTANTDHSDVKMSIYGGYNIQKWKKSSFPNELGCYFTPKSAAGKNMEYAGTLSAGAPIQINSGTSSSESNKWIVLNSGSKKKLKSKLSNLYINPSNNTVIQSSNAYEWNIIDAGNGYYYITTLDNKSAITLNGTSEGSSLKISNFEPGEVFQQWKIINATSTLSYILPKNDETKGIRADAASSSGVKIYTKLNSNDAFKWYLND